MLTIMKKHIQNREFAMCEIFYMYLKNLSYNKPR